ELFSYRTHRDRIVRLIGDTGSQHSDESQKLTPTGSADLESQVEMLLVCTGEEFLEAISSRLESELDVSNEKEIAVLVPQEHANNFINSGIYVETFTSARKNLSSSHRREYDLLRMRETIESYKPKEIIVDNNSDAVPVSSNRSKDKQSLKSRARLAKQRARQYAIEKAPRPFITAATGVKHGVGQAKLSTQRAVTPGTTFFGKASVAPKISPDTRKTLEHLPAVLFVIEDQGLCPESAL